MQMHVDVDGFLPRGQRLLLDGRDVTGVAYAFDDDAGWVDVYATRGDGGLIAVRDEDGRCIGAAKLRLYGEVTLWNM